MTTKLNSEATYETACQWWPDLNEIWTPIGWKEHFFRFNVLWDGSVMAEPCCWWRQAKRTIEWLDQGVQVTIAPEYFRHPFSMNIERYSYHRHDDSRVSQGWNDCAAPVLWSESMVDGLLLRREMFAHIPGGKAIETGIEPLFMWIRLSVAEICEPLPVRDTCRFFLMLNAPHMYTAMALRAHRFHAEKSEYSRPLRVETDGYSAKDGFHIIESSDKIRLAIAPGQDCEADLRGGYPTERDTTMTVTIPTKVGSSVDILLPMLPTDRDVFDKELALGYDNALKQANRYCGRPKPQTAAIVDTPEPEINATIEHSLKFLNVLSERNPATGDNTYLIASMRYPGLYPTPIAEMCAMFVDIMGYHQDANKNLEVFRKYQGTVVPPGDTFTETHPGYYAAPKLLLNNMNWFSDHGAILYGVCMHALLSGDKNFIDRWTDSIVKACEFIQHARSLTGHGGVEGVMPAAVYTDTGVELQTGWNDGHVYNGLATAVRLLKKIGHPRAAEFMAEAEDYKAVYQKAFRARAAEMPTWKDNKGQEHPFVPMGVSGDEAPDILHSPVYLDYGPLFLVFAGLFDADDPLMKSALCWFREGPPRRYYRKDSSLGLLPSLHHEMSSCEPPASWNMFHSHQLGDRERFLEGLYSIFAGGFSRQTYTACEARGGITGGCAVTIDVYLLRLAVIDDDIKEDELHLLRLVPKAWLRSDRETIFDNMPTVFGPVSLRFRLSQDGKTLKVSFKPEFREGEDPKRIVFHTPPVDGLEEIVVNGKTISADSNGKCIWNAKK